MKESSGVNQPYLYYGKVTCSHTDTLGSSVLTVYAVLFFNYFQLLRFRYPPSVSISPQISCLCINSPIFLLSLVHSVTKDNQKQDFINFSKLLSLFNCKKNIALFIRHPQPYHILQVCNSQQAHIKQAGRTTDKMSFFSLHSEGHFHVLF